MAEQFKIEGLDEVLARMRGLAPELKKKGVRSAARKAMNIVRDAARAGAKAIDSPETNTTPIWKNIAVSESGKEGKKIGGVVMRVGVRGGARLSKDPNSTGHWRLVEFGSVHNRARPFMRPALANNIERVTATFVAELNPAIDKAIAKASR